MKLRWHVWPMPIKLALCSICTVFLLYRSAGAPPKSKGKSIGTSGTSGSSKGQTSIARVAPTSTSPAELIFRAYTNDLERNCYSMTLQKQSASTVQLDPETCSSAAVRDGLDEHCKAECKDAGQQYYHAYFAELGQNRWVGPWKCLQSDRAVFGTFRDVHRLDINTDHCFATCYCQIRNKVKIRMPVIDSYSGGKRFVVSPEQSKMFWTTYPWTPVQLNWKTLICHPTTWFTRLSLPGFTTAKNEDLMDSPFELVHWQSTFEVNEQDVSCDLINWDMWCNCKMTDGKGQHYFRPKLCTPGRQKQKEPSQMAEPPKKVQEGSAAKGTRPDGAASHPLDGTEAHASNPADSTLPPETGSQQSLFSLWDAYPTLSSVSQDPNGVPRFGGLFACSDDPLSIYYQCPASDDPNAPQQYLYTGHFSGDPNTFYGQPECGPSTSCPPNGPPWQKRHESKRDVGDSGSVCALQARGDRAQRPAPFV